MNYESSFKSRLIYVFRINDKAHDGALKIGETSAEEVSLEDLLKHGSDGLTAAAKKRIREYTRTAGIGFDLLYTEGTLYKCGKGFAAFNDKQVQEMLKRSGIKKKDFDIEAKADEWFITDLDTVKKAIAAAKDGRLSLSASEIAKDKTPDPVVFRPEQSDAIKKTIKQFKRGNQMLWNAKMRFGKTLCALQVVKEMGFQRTLILTHRPVVNEGWFEDFGKIFYDRGDFYQYGSKTKGNTFDILERNTRKGEGKYVYFASMQDLRGSEQVGGNFDKNNEIFRTPWDLIIVDEAHEGTTTELGKAVFKELLKDDTKILRLSGTPFNLLSSFEEDEIFTWDYVMEQRAQADWDITHKGDHNPYSVLPKLNIYTFDLGNLVGNFNDEDLAFNFHEFFRVDDSENFVHKKEVLSFLNLIRKQDGMSNYPYSTEEYRNNFRHSLWMVPGVKEARALSAMLRQHKVFKNFDIVNVAGNGDSDEENDEALAKVKKAIGNNPDETYTITLSCGRLTTGVSVPEWTAVFMLAGSAKTGAASYMQTIFRVQTPATINGRVKEESFVFDFAPDRTLKVVAEAAKISAKAGKTTQSDRKIMGDFLNFCPIIACDGTRMRPFDVERMLGELKKVYVERVVKSGFEDNRLYNDELLKLDNLALKEFDELKKIIGSTKAMGKIKDIDINNQGFTEEEYENLNDAQKDNRKKGKELTVEQKALLEKQKGQRKQRDAAASILRGISIRMPLLIYGAELKTEKEEITIDNFASLVDDESWKEFMPNGVTKEKFETFKKYYEEDIFREAGKRIRAMALAADKLPIEGRIERLANIFNSFRNPDKETVLTPWRVVNMHLGDCLGGWNFLARHSGLDPEPSVFLSQPVFIDQGEVTKKAFSPDARILEINSKSGLYPLYMAYSIYRARMKRDCGRMTTTTLEKQQETWDKVIAENIFVVCKTPMAECITRRTLMGFRKGKVNAKSLENLVQTIVKNPETFINKVRQGKSFWKANEDNDMKFTAIVGNPPYQEMDGGYSVSAKPVYQEFVRVSKKMIPEYVSLIMPSRWFVGGKGLDDFREEMLNDKRISKLSDFETSNDIFPGVDIAGGVCYFLWDADYNGKCSVTNNTEHSTIDRDLNEFDVFIRRVKAVEIIKKIQSFKENGGKTLVDVISPSKPFGMRTFYTPKNSGIPCWFIQRIGLKFAAPKDVKDDYNLLDKWKLLLPAAPIAGQTDFSKPVGFYYDGNVFVAKPGTCCTESFVVAGTFDTKEEVLSFKSYLFTKTVRFLLLQSVVSQHVTRQNFQFIPDLGKYTGIYTDDQLRKRWKITKEEWKFIDSRIK